MPEVRDPQMLEEASAPTPEVGTTRDTRAAWSFAASLSSEGLWYWDVAARRVRVSTRTEELLGYGPGEIGGTPGDMFRHVDAADGPVVRRALRALLTGRQTRADAEIRVLTRGGARRWVLWRARVQRSPAGAVQLIAGVVADIDARRRTEERLQHETRHDQLTGLPNRLAFMDALCARIARAAAEPGRAFAVAYIDLDAFKVVNDTLGHAYGDAVLSAAAARLQECVGPDDLLARMGGDEFVALIDEAAEAGRIVETMHQVMHAPVLIDGRQVFTATSVGVRVSTDEHCKPSEVVRDADLAMYEAKRRGGARTVTFERSMHEAMVRRFTMHHELQSALHAEQFHLAYHPIFDTAERRLCGFEALLRWDHPTRGILPAAAFIEGANSSGVIVPIGRWVLREACRQLADWARAYPNAPRLSVGVNLCDRELADPGFVNFVRQTLTETGVDGGQLRLEMSEGAVASHLAEVVPVLEQLRDIGVQIQVDGFGAGRTSIGMLRRLPLTAIKIDRSVVKDVVDCEETRALVATILTFAARLNLDVVAEGVETDEQVALLASLGPCRYVQGKLARRLTA